MYRSYIKPREIIPSDGARLIAVFPARELRFWVNNSRAASTSNLSFSRTHSQNYHPFLPNSDYELGKRNFLSIILGVHAKVVIIHVKKSLNSNYRYLCKGLKTRVL